MANRLKVDIAELTTYTVKGEKQKPQTVAILATDNTTSIIYGYTNAKNALESYSPSNIVNEIERARAEYDILGEEYKEYTEVLKRYKNYELCGKDIELR